ncbi:DNA ligase [Hyperthermus butylicus]|uniref:DNA ligase n=1 Tax=Hyperthermus butylicus (strain DSM 5456 / JCM 9403 / PLM1-5) TaxID=415426 RepID=DNLI_HYPBU|nr:DNA ligase [Hyperthermus butylicus]A2BJX6.1 RecName: Full=DNA ligase; AltName: Full=Polydeoxyribonucleotide synthase [ATP/ADP/GTP] [Hyperthermus butylicus DSM 5456]ABM80287.1 ATP-dependent DNA ligase [Hyperthermus butylicus DSM 5456]
MSMPFSVLAETFEKLERVTARTQMLLYLVELFKKTPPEIIDKVVYFIQGKLWPDWKGLPELGIGEKMLIKAASIALHVSEKQIEQLVKKLGDTGKAIEMIKREKQQKQKAVGLLAFMQKPSGGESTLTVEKVYDTLARIALVQGEGSRDIKLKLLAGLLAEASPREAKYIARFVEGRLRLGVGDATIMEALAVVYGGSAAMRSVVERAYNLRADLGMVAKILATQGIDALKNIKPEVGVPIRPMLAERLNDPVEIIKKLGGRALVEYKYDGERAQIHKKGDKIWIFSRRLENITHMYPDVVEMAKKGIKAEEAIVEGEIVAIDPETGEFRPFQVLMHRRRKKDVHAVLSEIPVAVFLFDTLYVNGEDLTLKPLPARHEVLEKIIEQSDTWRIAEGIVTSDPQELESFFLKAIEDGAEGVMAKAIHDRSIYQAGARGWLWIKYKRDYKSEMSDTVDLVVIGAFYGKGRRGGKFGALLMAAYDPDTDTFKSVCKVGSGFTDEDLERLDDMLKPYISDKKPARVDSQMKPDVWVEPTLVAEIIGAELTLSPIHTCCYGWVKSGAGISIRFPRFIRWRPDKGPEDATTTKELYEMYKRQLRRIKEEEAPTGV